MQAKLHISKTVKSSRSHQRDALNVSNHSCSRTVNLDFGLAKLDELSDAQVINNLQRLYEASWASLDADNSASYRSRPS